ncbi:MAG: FAD-binding protein [Archangium sp.]|nr:FAD-binding protein [Archangium sp.]
MATPQDYLNLVAAIKAQPTNAAFHLQLQQMLAAQPELADTRADDPARYYHHNTVMPQWPAKFLHPKSEAELIQMLEDNKNAFGSFRAMGDGYGFANAAATGGCLVQMAGMNDLLPLEAENFDQNLDFDEDEYVRFEGGITFGKLNDALALTNRTVCQQPGYRSLTVAGCASAGGHGSGIGLYGISGWIQAVELAYFDQNKNVKIARIEPANGLTDPAKYAQAKDQNRYELIKNDVLFHAARCAQGHLGIITALTLKVRGRYTLKEDRWMSTWDEAWAQLPAMFANPSVHSVHVWINPYATDAAAPKNPKVLITRLTKTDQPPWGVRGIGILFGGPNILTDVAGALLGNNPGPGIDSALAMCAKMDVRLKSTDALDFGPPNDLAVNAASLGFDASKGNDVMQQLLPQILAWKADGLLFTSPIGMRWVKASEDFLSPQYQRDTIMLEVPLLKPVVGNDTSKNVEALNRYANLMMNDWEGRPHWGQQNPMSADQFKANYKNGIPSFVTAMKKFNSLKMFDGPLTAQLGLRALVDAS